MISPREADTIKQVLGPGYAKKILQFLIDNNRTRDSGEDFSRQDVYNVMLGARENEEMESAIIDLVAITKAKKDEELAKRQAILK